MSNFSDLWINAFYTGKYVCPKCGAEMEFEDEQESVLICETCGYDVDIDDYGHEDDLDERYPTKEEVCGYEEDEEDDYDDDEDDDYEAYYDPDMDE